MKILFFGDSITDACRAREKTYAPALSLGCGYAQHVASRLIEKSPTGYEFVNTGIAGHRIVDLYARVATDVWAHTPDLVSILVGINDVWHETDRIFGVEPARFERVYRMLIEETMQKLPRAKILLCAPFMLKMGVIEKEWSAFCNTHLYIEIVEKLAKEYGLYFLPLQEKIDEAAAKYGAENVLFDGVHPAPAGAVLIAGEWLKVFEKIEEDIKK